VSTFDGKHVAKMDNSTWNQARTRARLKGARVRGLRHTFGQYLRAAGVALEDRKALRGHESGAVTY
jgi:integrase